jgi:ankyrin repeat protein
MKIHDLARAGDVAGVRRELDSAVPVDVRDPTSGNGGTPLYEAAGSRSGTLELVQLLLERGADPNALCGFKRQDSVLLHAVKTWDLDRLAALLDAGADIAFRTESGYDVLTSCLYSEGARRGPGLLAAVKFLIERGAPLGGASKHGESALNVASRLGRFDVVALLLDAGTDPAPLRWTELHRTVALGTLDMVQRALADGAELEARDCWDRTAWLLSVQIGALEKIELLAAAGSDRTASSRGGKHAFLYAIEGSHRQVVDWLIAEGMDVNQTDDSGRTALMEAACEGDAVIVQSLLAAGADPGMTAGRRGERCAMRMARTVEVMRELQGAGADLADTSDHVRALLTRVEDQPVASSCTPAAFHEGRSRRFGGANPEPMDVPFWRAMVAARSGGYTARRLFAAGEERKKEPRDPVWCYARYGQSITELPDGRVVEIGGEHEDSYDPDFCIYNDVVVYDGLGGFTIYGYPRDVFPPTDFHTATLVDNWIYVIGSLGYPADRRYGHVQVFRLSTAYFHMEQVETHGDEPGWISRHRARLETPSSIRVSGGKLCTEKDYVESDQQFVLDVRTALWTRLSASR